MSSGASTVKIICRQEQGQKPGTVMVLSVSLARLIKSSVMPRIIHRTVFKATHTALLLMPFPGHFDTTVENHFLHTSIRGGC